MALVHIGVDRLARVAGAAQAAAVDVTRAGAYAARTFGSPAGLRGLAVEGAWLTAHLAVYPAGLVHAQLRVPAVHRTDPLPPVRRSLVVTDVEAAGTPILLLHGIMDNRSVFTVFRRSLRRRGFGVVHAVNYSVFTEDIRTAAHRLHRQVDELRELAGAERIHIVGHSLGGMIARYYVQRMGGSAAVDTLVTLGSPHGGTLAAHLLPTPLARQLRPGSDVIAELAQPAPGCHTRFLVVWSRMDQMVLPQRNGRLRHPDLDVEELGIRDVGHLALPIDPRTVRWVAAALGRTARATHPLRPGQTYSRVTSERSATARHPHPDAASITPPRRARSCP
ncbi:alpha/beta hydrolase family protein [Pseudonocardia hierapolitana]|uniref:Alpha/beta hydrolase family protein n=1 Tax=Pseudonocardia hierapolitana TaxID=1128676 RepID=A0A561SUB6_9PSEU|nr:alpha/beta fold hydrolase [Pseudonocardia hierapolitana]TWF78416.1 alpha/beta hydrolase family protein [Pseudonocardia hierapolitana]